MVRRHTLLIPFDDGAMDFPEEDLPAVADASHEVIRAADEFREIMLDPLV